MAKAVIIQKNLHRLFLVSLFIKAFDGLLEVLGGLSLVIFSPATINNIFTYFTKGELLEDPQDRFFSYLEKFFQHISVSTQTFAGFYILAHGLLNLFLVIGIYKEKLWAYFVAIGCISLFIAYQLYRLSHNYSLGITLLTLFDALFIFLTWHEYKYHKNLLGKRE